MDFSETYYNEVLKELDIDLPESYNTFHSSGNNEIQEVFYGIDCINNDIKFKPDSNRIIHFTSIKALVSILKDKQIRAYNIHHMNDTKEIDFLASKFEINEDTIRKFKHNTFIFSGCSDKILGTSDELNLWRLYGEDGNGCCIIFEYNSNPSATDINRYNVKYIENLENKHDNFIKKHNEFNTKHHPITFIPDQFLLSISAFHKSALFATEKEQRLYIDRSSSYYDEINLDFNSNNQIIRYIDIPLDYSVNQEKLKNLPVTPKIKIHKIIFGFKVNSSIIEKRKYEFLYTFFKNEEYPSIDFSDLDTYK